MQEDYVLSDVFIHYLFGTEKNKDLLLSFINAVLEDAGFPLIKKVEILNPFNIKEFKLDKETILDIKAVDENNHIYNIEIQVIGNISFIPRTLYYWARLYSSQIKEKQYYKSLYPVISINLLDFILFKEFPKNHTCFMLLEKDNTEFALTDHIQMHYIELPKFKKEDKELAGLLEKWMYYMKNINEGEEKMKILLTDELFHKAEREYKQFFANDSYRDLQEKRQIWKRDILSYLDDALNEGIEKGIEKKAIETANNLLDLDISIENISKATGLPLKKIQELENKKINKEFH